LQSDVRNTHIRTEALLQHDQTHYNGTYNKNEPTKISKAATIMWQQSGQYEGS